MDYSEELLMNILTGCCCAAALLIGAVLPAILLRKGIKNAAASKEGAAAGKSKAVVPFVFFALIVISDVIVLAVNGFDKFGLTTVFYQLVKSIIYLIPSGAVVFACIKLTTWKRCRSKKALKILCVVATVLFVIGALCLSAWLWNMFFSAAVNNGINAR